MARDRAAAAALRRGFVEQLRELLGHRAAQLLGIHDGHGPAIIARHVMADADGGQLHRRSWSRSPRSPGADAVPDNCRNSPTGWNRPPARRRRSPSGSCAARAAPISRLVRPHQRLAVDILLQQALAHHQAEILARAPPGRVGGLVDDVAQVVEAAGRRRLAGLQPFLARLAALPGAGGEAEDLDLDAAALQGAAPGCRRTSPPP